jgi:hypothetical protein
MEVSMNPEFIDLVEKAAKMRGEEPVPRDFISEALEKIEKGEEKVEMYPTGAPSLRGISDLARRIQREVTST